MVLLRSALRLCLLAFALFVMVPPDARADMDVWEAYSCQA